MTTTYEAQRDELIEKIDALESAEPECSCTQLDVDYFDNRNCEVCNPQSSWNREIEALEAQLKDVQDGIAYQRSGEGAWVEEEDAA